MTTPDHSFPVRTGTPFAEIDLTTLMRSLGHSGWLGMRFHAQSDGWIELADTPGGTGTTFLVFVPAGE